MAFGTAAIQYAQENKGWFPPCHQVPGNATIEKFLEYGTNATYNPVNPSPSAIRDAMARYFNVKVPPYPAPTGGTYKSPDVPVMYCPVALQLGQRMTAYNAQPENFLAKGTGSGQNEGKFLCWWVANPYDVNSVQVAPYNGNADLLGAFNFAHMETGVPVFDTTRPCKAGIDYLRHYGDKNAANIAICVDQSRQQTASWFWMHGTPSSDRRKGWKNELFGDGHVDTRRPDQVVGRWSAANPAAW